MSIILKVTVQDRPGVLDRITGLIRRNSWNISEINAGEKGGGSSSINIRLKDEGADLQILGRAIGMLDCVLDWEECASDRHVIRELLILKAREADLPAEAVRGGRVIGRDGEVLYLEYTGFPWEIDALLEAHADSLIDCTRAGVLSLRKGEEA